MMKKETKKKGKMNYTFNVNIAEINLMCEERWKQILEDCADIMEETLLDLNQQKNTYKHEFNGDAFVYLFEREENDKGAGYTYRFSCKDSDDVDIFYIEYVGKENTMESAVLDYIFQPIPIFII